MFARLRFVSTVALLAGIPLFAAGQSPGGLSFQDLERLKNAKCTACHDTQKRIVGPSWQEIATRYYGDRSALKILAQRVQDGSSGNWGSVPMPSNFMWQEDAESLVRAVLTANAAPSSAPAADAAGGGHRRLALVIGNDAYPKAPLKAARNDAAGMEHILGKLGFQVIRRTDLKASDLRFAWRTFQETLPLDATVFIYFSGHGVRVDGADYMLGTDAGIEQPVDLGRDAISLDAVLQDLAARKTQANIVVLDTSLDNPFATKSATEKGVTPGLATVPPQTLVALAAGAGGVVHHGADKKDGFFSTFTEHLLKVLDLPGLSIELALKRTGDTMRTESNNAQAPWWISSIKDDVVLAQTSVATSGPTRPDKLASSVPPASSPASAPAAVPQPAIAVAPAAQSGSQERITALEARAQQGDVSAMKLLANIHQEGRDGIDKDLAKARLWLIMAARVHKDAEAYHRLGELYEVLAGTEDEWKFFHLRDAQGAYWEAAQLGYPDARRSYERLAGPTQPATRASVEESAGSSSFSFGDFLRGVGKVIGAAGIVAGARYNDPGMIQQGAALIGGDANEIARNQAAQNARQQAARQAQGTGGAGGGDCAQHWNNAQRALKEREDMKSLTYKGPSGTTGQAGAQNDAYTLHMNTYRACISQ